LFALTLPRKLVAVADALLGMVDIDLLLLLVHVCQDLQSRLEAGADALSGLVDIESLLLEAKGTNERLQS
jgi:hypothetical protein